MLSTIRHAEIFASEENDRPITLIGCGAIGSRVFTALAELGLTKITSYDFDIVEIHNLCNQIFLNHHLDGPKVEGLRDWYEQKMGPAEVKYPTETMQFINEAVVADTQLKGTIFLMVDTMAAREQIFKENIVGNVNVRRVIDVRMAATHGNVLSFDPHTQGEQWLETIFPDELGEVSACGSSLTVGTTASVLANMAVWQYMHFCTNPVAGNGKINLFLKPFIMTTEDWKK